MHNAAFRALGLDWVYVAFEVPPGAGRAALAGMRALGIDGLNVTMPHKTDVAGAVDRLTPAAEALGAVNTVMRGPQRDELVGDNTDGAGFIDALRIDEGFEPAGRRCVVVGAGGAGRAVVRALAEAGAASDHGGEPHGRPGDRRRRPGRCRRPGGATGRRGRGRPRRERHPVGHAGGDAPDLPVDPATLGPGQLVVDLVYHPAVTPLVEAARARGAAATNGLGMLIHQAAHTIRIWTGEDPPLEVMSAAALGELARRG